MRQNENGKSPADDRASSSAVEGSVSGKPLKKGWTLGNSQDLLEGQPAEPLAATVGWIVVPLLVFLLLISLFAV